MKKIQMVRIPRKHAADLKPARPHFMPHISPSSPNVWSGAVNPGREK